MQRWFNRKISINAIHFSNWIKDKNYITISPSTGKAFLKKPEQPFRLKQILKSLNKLGTEWYFLYMIKGIYKKLKKTRPFLGAQMVKNLLAIQKISILGSGRSPGKGMATHSSILVGESHRQRRLAVHGVENWMRVHGVTTEWLTFPLHKKTNCLIFNMKKRKLFFFLPKIKNKTRITDFITSI